MNLAEQEQTNIILQPNKKKKGGIWSKLLFIGILLSPIILFLLMAIAVIFMAMVVFLKIDDSQLSEHGANEIPEEYIPIYQNAGKEYDIDWILLASIHKVETNFGEFLGDPTSGIIGHTQFNLCTWVGYSYPDCLNSENGIAEIPEEIYTDLTVIAQYGGYGVDANDNKLANPMEVEDSIHATAKYLSTYLEGKKDEESLKNAIYAYNHADWYVSEVLYYYDLYSDSYDGSGQYAEILGDIAWVVPYTKNITSYFNPYRVHPITGQIQAHKGIDISDWGIEGKPAVAFSDGEVIYSQWNSGGYGYLVIIQHKNNIKTYYAHLKQQGIPIGTKVKAGQVIGYVGTTGDSTGPHLHFEIRVNDNPVDPLLYLSEFLD